VREIVKGVEPRTITDTRFASTTDLSTPARARAAFDQIDKAKVREALVKEQGWLCAFCMIRIRPKDDKGVATMRIAHRAPIEGASTQALTWKNLLGSCEGRERSNRPDKTCDVAQRSSPLTVDPTVPGACAHLRYERRDDRRGLFIVADDPAQKKDIEETLKLNSGDLPELREAAYRAFCALQRAHAPKEYGKPAKRAYFSIWVKREDPRLPEMLGVIEHMIRE
jgi:uncharacterized protein (TIGR02646 family)